MPRRPAPAPLILLLLVSSGCAAPIQAQRVSQLQSDAAAQLTLAAAADAAALRAAVSALLDIRRESIAHGAEAEIIRLLLTPAGDPDPAALDADLALEQPSTVLAAGVRAGAMTTQEARAWLHDYALALQMSAGSTSREGLLAQLAPVRRHDAEAAQLLAALDARAAASSKLAADAAANAATLHFWNTAPAFLTAESQQLLFELWQSSRTNR